MLTEREREVTARLDDETFQRFLEDLKVVDQQDTGFLLSLVFSRLKTKPETSPRQEASHPSAHRFYFVQVGSHAHKVITDELVEPCPFCGQTLVFLKQLPGDPFGEAKCLSCMASGPVSNKPLDAWNRRA